MIEWTKTARGFGVGRFRDGYGGAASVQNSSSAMEPKCWVGLDEGAHFEGKCTARMHLTQDQAHKLAVVLLRFANTGSVTPPAEKVQDYTTYGEPLTPAVAQDLIRRCEEQRGDGPPSDQLGPVITYAQQNELMALWYRLPSRYSIWSTLQGVAQGTIDADLIPLPNKLNPDEADSDD